MKLEEQIKNSLSNHEEAYNPTAWEAMKAKLDAKYPVAPKSGNGKWWIAAGITAIAITSLLIWNNSTTKNTEIATQTQKDSTEDLERKESNTKNNPQSTSAGNSEVKRDSFNLKNTPLPSSATSNKPTSPETNTVNSEIQHQNDATLENSISSEPTPQININTPLIYTIDEEFKLSINKLCVGSNVINNIDSRPMILLDENKNNIATINGNKSKTIEISTAGMVHIGYYFNGMYKNKKSIIVQNAREIEVQQIDEDIKYENGLPIMRFTSDEELTWSANGQITTGKEATFHFFKQGNQNIELTQKNEQCLTKKTIAVNVEKYNLLAPDAFNPNGFNKTWIPYALIQRNIDFKMVIIDISNGEIVYETTDVNQPWDGTDIRTGRISKEPIQYAWKVQITNPQKGESTNYQGKVRKL